SIPSDYDPELYVSSIRPLVDRYQPSCILLLSSSFGDDLGARLAAELQAPFVCQCVDFKTGSSERPVFVKSSHRRMLYAQWMIAIRTCTIVTVVPEILDPFYPTTPCSPELVRIPAGPPARQRIFGRTHRKGDPKTIDLCEAEVIVVAGRGALHGKGYDLTARFADLLGATLACTRPLADQGILPFDRQIGQTGKAVSPKLLITCGVSGAFEFTVGIERSAKIIAINTDANARILQYADLGIVGQLEEVLPEMIDQLQHQRPFGEAP
ncbi:MAG: electron transfer flavoprotein subunit alpha/FixB family protein, partial [Desulfobacterales bacterium]